MKQKSAFLRFVLFLSFFLFSALSVSCASTGDMVKDPVVTDVSTTLEEKMNLLGFPQVELGEIESFFDGAEWIERLVRLIEQSNDYIVFTSFLASECDENKVVYDLLCEKAEQGVRIYFLYDGAGSMDMTEARFHIRPIERLRESGVRLYEFNPMTVSRIPKLAGLLTREHRKFFVFDGRFVAVGGMNLNYISNTSYRTAGQRDSMFCFESPSAAAYLLEQFVFFWNTFSWEKMSLADFNVYSDSPASETQASVFPAWIVNQDLYSITMPKLIGSMFASAREEILILPLLPLEDRNTVRTIENAVNRGVSVQMILPNDPRKDVYKAAHYSVSKLVDTGMEIYIEPDTEDRKNLLHEKLMIVDSEYVLIGSVNLNYRSLVLSNEIGILVHSREFASFMKNHFAELKEGCSLLTAEDAKKWKKFSWMLDYYLHFIMG